LEHVSSIPDGHHLHLPVAYLSRKEMRQKLHVMNVHSTVEVRNAIGARVTMMVCPCRNRRTGERQAGASRCP
jgi:hypothetical protein